MGFNLFGFFKKRDPNKDVLAQLVKAGSNLSKPHNVEFFLYFPSQTAAEQAASNLRDDGFQVQVDTAAQGNDWLCLATKTMAPELSALRKISEDLENLAESLAGNYDGWGTEVEK
jgi:regulator of RNase E activity RraB